MFAANNEFLDLGGTFIDLENFGVTHQFFNWIITVETVTTMNLNSVSSVLIGSITSKKLGKYFIGCVENEYNYLPWR